MPQRIAQLLGLAEGSTTAEQTAEAVAAFLAAAAAERPLVVLVDDIHWAEPALLDLLAAAAGADRGRRRSCCSAWRGRSCSRPGPTGR